MCRETRSCKVDELLLNYYLATLQRHVGDHGFSSIFIFLFDDCNFKHGGVFVENILNLARPYFEFRNNDLAFKSIDQTNPSLFVHDGDITCSEIAVGYRTVRGSEIPPVSGYNLGSEQL